MKNKYEVVPQPATTKKPAKAKVSDADFRRRLKNISDWRKKRLDQLSTKRFALKFTFPFITNPAAQKHSLQY